MDTATLLSLPAHPEAARICAVAQRWIGTPFVDQAQRQGAGVDCANVLLAIAQELGVVPRTYTAPPYHPDWHLHHQSEWLYTVMREFGGLDLEPTHAGAGDVILFKFRGNRSHGHCGLLLEEGRILHALRHQGVVIHQFRGLWQRYGTRALRFPPLPGGV